MENKELQKYINENQHTQHIKADPVLQEFVFGLSRYCDFLDAWKDRTPDGRPISEMGYTRSDYDWQWWTYPFPLSEKLRTEGRAKELDKVTSLLTKAFPTLTHLGLFCELFAEDLRRDQEYNLYYKGQEANYWIRCIIRPRDYNLYVHSIILPDKEV